MGRDFNNTVSLREFVTESNLELKERLEIFIAICEEIRRVHADRRVHNDINFDTCRIDSAMGSVTVLPSELSESLGDNKNKTFPKSSGKILGRIEYISPERTGRTTHQVDLRSDCYSLGVVLYQLLTDRLPFDFKNPLENIHAHIALPPVPINQINHDIPDVLSKITAKLLAKNPADRYQSVTGLVFDLRQCLKQLEAKGTIEIFPLAKKDVSPRFEIPTKLYGRYREVRLLCDAYKEVTGSTVGSFLISGPPGIGKSFLVNNLQEFLREDNGYFISGKFDQYEKTIPYSAIIQAFSDLVHKILTLNEVTLEKKRNALLNALGKNGRVIMDVIPALELVIGKQPAPCDLSVLEAHNRFNYLFQKFVRSITSEHDPIIIFLDDLQWADRASLELMQAVLLDSGLHNLFFIGAYRNLEARENPFLGEFLENIARQKPKFQHLSLEPVDNEYIQLLIKDMLAVDLEDDDEFIRLTAEKTNCNPFFIREFLISLYEEGLIRFMHRDEDGAQDSWRIDLEGVVQARLPETIVELLTQRIRKLSEETQEILKIAACIGTRFYPELLKAAFPGTVEDIRFRLKEALEQGMVVRVKEGYKFIHDRVRETVYQLNDLQARTKIHYAVGNMLISGETNEISNDIFLMVSQLNAARPLLCKEEADELIQHNLAAGKKAKQLTAHATAMEYFSMGLDLLGRDGWETRYELALTLHNEAAETAYMCANLEEAERLVGIVLQKARTDLDRVDAYEIRVSCLSSRNRFAEMMHEGIQTLDRLGCRLPANPGRLRIFWELIALKWSLRGKTFEDLLALEFTNDPKISAQNRIRRNILSPAYRSRPNLFRFIVLNGLRSSLRHGDATNIEVYFAFYGLLLGSVGRIDTGYEFGQLALALSRRSQIKLNSKVQVLLSVNAIMLLWKHHFRDTLQPLLETYKFCMESGNIVMASNVIAIYFNNMAACGIPIKDMFAKIDYYYDIMQQCRQKTALEFLGGLRHQLVSIFTGHSDFIRDLKYREIDAEAMRSTYEAEDDKISLSYFYFSNLVAYFHSGNYSKALKYSNLANKILKNSSISVVTLRLWWYDSLARLAMIGDHNRDGKTGKKISWRRLKVFFVKSYHLIKVAANQRTLKRWARHAPMNLMNKWSLVEAEKARIRGQNKLAEAHYLSAVQLSQQYNFLPEEALANELLASFYLENSLKQSAKTHFREAIKLYERWGASIQRNQLLKIYYDLFGEQIENQSDRHESTARTRNWAFEESDNAKFEMPLAELDLQLFTDTLEAISNKNDLKSSLVTLSDHIMRYTGAQRVSLLIKKDGLTVGVDNRIGEKADVMVPMPMKMAFPAKMIQYVLRTRKPLLIDDAAAAGMFSSDPYVRDVKVKSVSCIPIIFQDNLMAVLYLENNLSVGVFTTSHQRMLTRLCGQIALFLHNALFESVPKTGGHQSLSSEQLIAILQNRYGLTPQEANISSLFKEGHTRLQICDMLNISATTLKKHLQMIYDKTVNLEDDFKGEGRVDKLSRLILFLFRQTELS